MTPSNPPKLDKEVEERFAGVITCPVQGCEGYKTSSTTPRIKNHIRKMANMGDANHKEYIENSPSYLFNKRKVYSQKQIDELLATATQRARTEEREKIKKIIESFIPTDDMGGYGGYGAMSDNEVAEMFLEEIIPEVDSLERSDE